MIIPDYKAIALSIELWGQINAEFHNPAFLILTFILKNKTQTQITFHNVIIANIVTFNELTKITISKFVL